MIPSYRAAQMRGLLLSVHKKAYLCRIAANDMPMGLPEYSLGELLGNKTLPESLPCVLSDGDKLYLAGTQWDDLHGKQTDPGARGPMHGTVCLVTGAAQGFGEGIARALVKNGSIVVIGDINEARGKVLCTELNEGLHAPRAFFRSLNVTQSESFESMAGFLEDRFGGLDLFVSNAGVLKAGAVDSLSLEDFRFVTEVNYVGYFVGVRALAPLMGAQNRLSGRWSDIVQINSKSGLEGSNRNSAYAGGKFGGIGLTQSFALEMVDRLIKVNSLCPGNFFDGPLWSDPEKGLFVQYLRTGKVPGAASIEDVKRFYEAKVPMGRGCLVEDVMRALYYVVEQAYETGQAVPVTGGQVMLN